MMSAETPGYNAVLMPPQEDELFYTYNPIMSTERAALIRVMHVEDRWGHTFSDDDRRSGTILYCKHWKWICLAVLFLGGIGATVYYLLRKN